MCISVTNQRIPLEREQLNSPAESGVYVKHLNLSGRHAAFMNSCYAAPGGPAVHRQYFAVLSSSNIMIQIRLRNSNCVFISE